MGFFDPEEKKKISSQFWNDGTKRRVTCEKDWRESKSDPNKQVCWIRAYDVDTKNEMSFLDFNFLKALGNLPEDQKYEDHILEVTPTKTGDREYNGKTYDVFEYDIKPTGEFAEHRTTVKAEDVDF